MSRKLVNILGALALIAVIGLHVYLRLYPAEFPQLRDTAVRQVEDRLYEDARRQVDEQYPDFNPGIRKKMALAELERRLGDEEAVRTRVEETWRTLRDPYRDENGHTYLMELDPWHWARYTQLLLDNGHPGDAWRDGRSWDTRMLAPAGHPVTPHRFLFYVSAGLYKAVSLLLPELTVWRFMFFLPVIFTVLFLLAVFLFCRYWFSPQTGIVAAFLAGAAPIVIHRGSAGWYDMDILSLLLPLLAVWALAGAVNRRSWPLTLPAGAIVALFAFTWQGWFFIYIVILGYFLFSMLNAVCLYVHDHRRLRGELMRYALTAVVFAASVELFGFLLMRQSLFFQAWNVALQYMGMGSSHGFWIWPDTLYTVGELAGRDFAGIFDSLQGPIHFLAAVSAMAAIYLRDRRSSRADVQLLLIFWFLFMMFASMKGVRFSFFLSIPLSVFLAEGLVTAATMACARINAILSPVIRSALMLTLGGALGVVLAASGIRAQMAACDQYPLIDDNWFRALHKIRSDTESTAIVCSWWDFGDWFKTIAGRGVLFDGQSQNLPIAYWMARTLLSTDETQALRILRMLSGPSFRIFDELAADLPDPYRRIMLFDRLCQSDRDTAEAVFERYALPAQARCRLREAFYGTPLRPAYFVVDAGMVNKMSAISFLGNWDFSKRYVLDNRHRPSEDVVPELMSLFSLSEDKALSQYRQVMLALADRNVNEVLSHREGFARRRARGRERDGRVYFDNGLVLDPVNESAMYLSAGGFVPVRELVIMDAGRLTAVDAGERDANASGRFLCARTGDTWRTAGISSRRMAESLFARLYFGRGEGLEHFSPFYADEEAGIYVFRIDWGERE